jgi:hypothetical protein
VRGQTIVSESFQKSRPRHLFKNETEMLMDAASSAAESSQAANGISDQRFVEQLDVIKKLKKFLFAAI